MTCNHERVTMIGGDMAMDCADCGERILLGEKRPDANRARIYPCDRCGIMRSKAEGGTVFTVCDACWGAKEPSK